MDMQSQLEQHWLRFLEAHGAEYDFELAREKARLALQQKDHEPVAALALQSLTHLASLLQRQQTVLSSHEIQQLARACSQVSELLASHSAIDGVARVGAISDTLEDVPPVPQSSSRHAARFRQQHASALNNRITRRRSAFGTDVPNPEDVDAMISRMGLEAGSGSPTKERPSSAGAFRTHGDNMAASPNSSPQQIGEQPKRDGPLRGHRARQASFQNLRHSQRRSGIEGSGIDREEIGRALKAAERALGLEPQHGAPSDNDLHHNIYHIQ